MKDRGIPTMVERWMLLTLTAILAIFHAPLSLGQETANRQPEPKADVRSVILSHHARFTVLTSKLIRMEWSADGVFEDRASFVFLNREMPVPRFTQTMNGHGKSAEITVVTDALRLTYRPGVGDGHFTAENLSVTFLLDGKPVAWHPGMIDTGNLLGTTRTLDGARGDKTKSPMEPGLLSRDGWVVVDDSERPLFDSTDFSFIKGEQSIWPWVAIRPAGQRQDLYFFGYGHAYKEELGDFVRVAGRIPLPPRFAFGSWWSRYWAYSDQELEELVHGFRANNVPLDVLVIDMDWHPNFGTHLVDSAVAPKDASGERKGWGGYSWNKSLFPDPELFLKHIHSDGLKTTLNLHPASGVQPWENAYPAMARAMGIDPATKNYVPFDITDKKFATNYMDLLHHPLEKQGVDFWWLDWQQSPTTALPGVNPTWWLNYVHFTDQEREGKRPLLFHRWGGLGNHRYEIGFSGDTLSIWDSLAFQPWFTATAADVVAPIGITDIGGHQPGAVDPELYTRWVQWGAYSPILRTHTTNNRDSERRIWAYPEPYSDVMRKAYEERYALDPYIYTEARRTYDTGVAFVHPLYYDWPDESDAYNVRNAYMFGDEMMIAPVTQPMDAKTQLTEMDLWVPPGAWVEQQTGRHFHGPARIKEQYSIDQVPVLIRSGALIPMQPPMNYIGEKPVAPLIVTVTPLEEGQKSSYTVYDDSDKGEYYKDGVCSWTELSAVRTGDRVKLTIKAERGKFDGMLEQRGYEFHLPGDWPPDSVVTNGRPLKYEPAVGKEGWRFEGNTLTTIITVAPHSVNELVTVEIHRRAVLEAKSALLDGFAGKTMRLREAYDALNHAGSGIWSPDTLSIIWQTGDRISYRPETTETELDVFQTRLLAAMKDIEVLAAKEPLVTAGESKEQSTRRMMLWRALAAMTDAR